MIHGGMRRAGVGLAGVLHGVLLLLMLLLPASRHVTGATLDPKDHPDTVKAVVGETARIPCLVPLTDTDNIYFISWTKRGIAGRVFSVDMREPDNPQAFVAGQLFGSRAELDFQGRFPYLKVEDLLEKDAGHYTCQVEIRKKRTQVAESTLKIIVPPGDPTILSEDGREVDILGPYNEGDTISVTCRVIGGQPSPRVSWFQEQQVLDEEAEQREKQVVKNTLRLGPLTREHFGTNYSCQAVNSDQVGPRSKEVTLQMYLKPLTVEIKKPDHPLVVGRQYNITCESRHGLPPADITWWFLGKKINATQISNEIRGNTSLSTLRFQPKVKNAGEELQCHAESSKIKHAPLVDSWRLEVHYAPDVRLEMAPGLDLHNVREGDDVTLVCHVKAIPEPKIISWYHKLMEVNYDASAGIERSGYSLHLRNVTRRQSGSYTCHASNIYGSGESHPIILNVMYVPYCTEKEKVYRGAAKKDDVELECNVKGSPGNITFSWFILTPEGSQPIPEENYTTQDLTSRLTYHVHDEEYYRNVTCYGENLVGKMEEPCEFQVTPAGKPDPLDNCTVFNQSSEALFVYCFPGYNGGLKQHFGVHVYEDAEGIRLNIKNHTEISEPKFTVDGLRAETEYLLSIYAENSKGKSEERKIYGFTLPAVGRPVLGVLIGVVGALVLVAIVVVVVMKLKGDSRRERILRHVAEQGIKLPQAPLHPKDDATYENVDGIPPKLKHANIYETVPYDKEKSSNNEDSEKDDVEYAELTFNNGKNKNKSNKRGGGPGGANGVIRNADDNTIYATIDHTRTEAQNQQQPQPLIPHQQHQQHPQAASKQGKPKKQVYVAQPGNKTGKHVAGDPNVQPQREADEIPLMDAALESSV
ncbi:hemicentin-1-like isoform X2 [Portunus trituberculatus]|uniref:hemicentin-1-like isoform X2 n=1 Tax=Portunus trituberculatus TaxID=210409 RepID=UPI001E1CB959|nr:hemicentin-1-like isoform X2 [Portunus trituberculatus]